MSEIVPAALDIEAASKYVGVSAGAFRTHVASDLRRICIGTRVLWLREDLDAWLRRAAGHNAPSPTPDASANPLDALM